MLVIALQILVFNQVNIGGYINPYIYPLLIILLPFDIAGWLLLLIAMALGLFVDLFTATLGMHLFATVFMAGLKPSIIKFLSLDKSEPGSSINVKHHGVLVSFSFLAILFFVHHMAYFLLESFSYSGFGDAVLRGLASVVVSVLLSFILILFFNNYKKHER